MINSILYIVYRILQFSQHTTYKIQYTNLQQGFIRFTKKTLILTLMAWVILVSSGLIYMFKFSKRAEAAWYDDNWAYRASIPITAHTSAENNVYITVTLDTATLITNSKLQSDCGDLRFTKENGELLPYFINASPGCNNAATTIQVNFDSFPAGAQTIYYYYGNPSAPNGFNLSAFSTAAAGDTEGSVGSEEKAPSPVAYWKFDDGQGTTAQDSTTNNLDGTLNNTPAWQTEDLCIAGKCLYFDGTNNENVSKSDDGKLDFAASDNFTIGAWVKRNGTSSANNFILTKAQSGYTGYKLYQDASGDYCFDVKDGTNTDTACTSAVEFDDNNWHLVQGVKSGTTSITLYVDGKQRAQDSSIAATGTLANTGTFYIGVDLDGTSNEWLGFIDEVKVYPYARTASQIQADFNSRASNEGASALLGGGRLDSSQVGGLSNGLVGYWKMDESSGNTADSSGNSTTLTNNNTTAYAAGKFGNAGSFTAASLHYFSTATTISGVKTAAFWVNPSATTDEYINLTASAYITSSSGTVSATGFTSPSIYVNGTLNGTITASAWNHVVITTDTAIDANQFEAGRANNSYVNGKMDEVRIYNRALSPNEVSQLYNFAPSPVGYWKLDEKTGQTTYDSSGNGNNGTLGANGSAGSDDPTWVSAKMGAGLSFDGGDYVGLGDPSSGILDFGTGDFTIETWLKFPLAGSSTWNGIITKGYTTSASATTWGLNSGNPATALVYNDAKAAGGAWNANYSFSSSSNGWHHIAITRTSGTSYKFYKDGVLDGTQTSPETANLANASNLLLGNNGDNRYLNSSMDEVKLYNYARTQKQIVSDMGGDAPFVIGGGARQSGPVGYWKFNEGVDNTCSGGSNDACNSGSAGSSLDGAGSNFASPATSTSGRTQSGKFGKALIFDGSDDVVTITNADPIDMDKGLINFTFSAWVYPTGAGENNVGQILQKGTNTYLRVDNPSGSNLDVEANLDLATTDANVNVSAPITTNAWNHIAVAWDGTTLTVYINGRSRGTGTGSGAISSDANNLLIGGTTTANFAGTIDDFKVYGYALTANEILTEFNRGSAQVMGALSDNSSYQANAANQEYCIPGDSTSCAAPVGRWDFEEGSGSTVYDKSGNAYNGTITGATYQTGKYGKALNFNGGTDAIGSISSISGVKTVSFWVKPASTTENFIDIQISPSTINISASSGTVSATGFTSPAIYVNGIYGGTISANTWNHIEVTTGTAITASALRFGRISTTSLSGKLDTIMLFNYARSAAQVAWDYNKGAPVGHWKFDECQGSTANDSSGNSNTGTITIGASGTQTAVGTCTGSANTAWKDGVTGKRNYSLDFDGTDDVVTVSNATTIDLNTNTGHSFSAWVYANSDGEGDLGQIYQKGTNTYLRVSGQSGSNLNIDAKLDLATTDATVSLTAPITTGTWNHITVTYEDDSDDEISVYVNGILRGTSTDGDGAPAADTNSLLIGGTTTANFDGQIDDFRMYGYSLTATQVKTLYNNGAVNFGPSTGAP